MASLTNKHTELDALMPLIRERLDVGQTVTFSPRGTSMLPMLRQGKDTVTLSPLPSKLKKYDLPLYRRENGQYVLHRIVRVGENYTCIGDNQFACEETVSHSQMIAVVSSFTRGERSMSVLDFWYRLYCVLHHITRPVRHFFIRVRNKISRMFRAVFPRRHP